MSQGSFALTRTIDGHTRQRLDLAALGSGIARGRVTVLSASGAPNPWARAHHAERHARVCRHLPPQSCRGRGVDLRGKHLAYGTAPEVEVHDVVIDLSSPGNRPRATTGVGRSSLQEVRVEQLSGLSELQQSGKMHWSENDQAWAAQPRDVVEALAHEGFAEYKLAVTRSRRDRPPTGGVWQGLNLQTGVVASAIWVQRAPDAESIVFIDIDGEMLDGALPHTLTLHT